MGIFDKLFNKTIAKPATANTETIKPSENKPLENKEGLKNPFSIIYRDNVSLGKIAPIVEAEIISQGGKIGIKKVFPAGTPEEEINAFLLENKNVIANTHQVFDTTTKIPFLKITGNFEENSDYQGTLDNWDSCSISYAIQDLLKEKKFSRAVQIDSLEEKRDYLEELGLMYETMLSKASAEFKAKEFIIVKGISQNVPAWKGVTLIDHENHREHTRYVEDTDESRLRNDVEEFAKLMKTWFNNVGITNVEIISTVADISAMQLEKLKKGDAVIIFDRHTGDIVEGDKKESSIIRNKSALETPLSTFASCMMSRFYIPVVSNDEIEKQLRKFVSEGMEYQKEKESVGMF